MDSRVVSPLGPLRGTIRVPGDKSISHRALLLNAIAHGNAVIDGILESEDVLCTRRAVEALGVKVKDVDGSLHISPPDHLNTRAGTIDCGNSGTTMRLLCGLLAGAGVEAVLDGDHSLRGRPMGRVVQPLTEMGAAISGREGGTRAPLVLHGGALRSHEFDLSIASAQVKSCLLLAGMRTGVRVREPAQSRNHTEILLTAMGAKLSQDSDGWWVLSPTERLNCVDVSVPGDISSAAFWMVAGSIVPGSEIVIERVGVNPTRSGVLDALQLMGARIERIERTSPGGEPTADLRVRSASLHGVQIKGELALRCLDELPVLAVAAAFADGETLISDAAELRVKESDRIAMVAAGLASLGVDVEELPDGMRIVGGGARLPTEINAKGDHRIAMAFAVAALAGRQPISIHGAHSVLTSYPKFFDHLEGLSHA